MFDVSYFYLFYTPILVFGVYQRNSTIRKVEIHVYFVQSFLLFYMIVFKLSKLR